jgi:hypothetical protein
VSSTPFSYRQYPGNGATTVFSVPFPYLLKAHVHLYIGFDILDGTFASELVDGVDFSWTSSAQVQCTTAPAAGQTLTVIRQTPNQTRLVDWQDGSNLIADDLDTADLQNLYVVQEQQDRNAAGIAQSTLAYDASVAATAAVAGALFKDGSVPMEASFDLGGHKAINAIAPTADTDLATKQYVDLRSGTSGPPGYTNWSYTATGGETALGSTGLGGGALEYQVGKELVLLNGVLLLRGDDYTAEDGASITLALALAQGDHISVRCVNYLPSNPGASYSYMRWRKTAAGGETAVGPTGDLSASGYTLTLAYAVNREQVYLNGALLARGGDYAAFTGTTITGLAALAAGDVIEVHSINAI